MESEINKTIELKLKLNSDEEVSLVETESKDESSPEKFELNEEKNAETILSEESDNNDDEEFFNELPDNDEQFFGRAKKYWADISPTVNGMLGGFGNITNIDIRGSSNFLEVLYKIKPSPGKNYALDCGAGIGRVTKNLLLPKFNRVDIVEQDKHFCDLAKNYIGMEDFGQIFNLGLQEFTPEPQKYDIIWTQWVLGHLKDNHLIDFFKRCANGITKHGIIVIKENFTSTNEIEIDSKDSSMTRPLNKMKEIISMAGLRIVKETKQTNFPKGLYPVHIIALRPKKKSE